MAAATCSHCGAWTATATGHCTVCRQSLEGSQTWAATAPAPPAYAAPAHPRPAYAAPAYPPPAYPAAAYPPPYGYPPPPPGYAPAPWPGAVPAPWYAPGYPPPMPLMGPAIPVAQFLAKKVVGLRWAAALVDFLIVFSVWFLLFPRFETVGGAAGLGLTMLWGFGYYTIPDSAGLATPGKLALGLRVVDIRLLPAGALRIAGRSCELFVWAILFGLLFFLIQIYYTLKIGQGLGDYVSKTYVVRKRDLAMNRTNLR